MLTEPQPDVESLTLRLGLCWDNAALLKATLGAFEWHVKNGEPYSISPKRMKVLRKAVLGMRCEECGEAIVDGGEIWVRGRIWCLECAERWPELDPRTPADSEGES